MRFGDVEMLSTATGEQYLEYNERLTKTRTGQGNSRPFAPKMFATPGNPRCPVNTFKEFIRRRPEDTLSPESRFYLQINRTVIPDASGGVKQIWFTKQPLGKNTLGDLAKTMSIKAGLTGRKVNHSGRKTTVTSLLHNKVEATTVMQLTGHKNVQSLNEYSSASIQQQKQMSNILSDIGSGSRGVVPQQSTSACSGATEHQQNQLDFPDDDHVFENIELNEIVDTIQNYESSAKKDVKISIGNSSKFSILPYASLGNVTINIYNSDK